jgi:tetratricopeptide (TPR) repeat protein
LVESLAQPYAVDAIPLLTILGAALHNLAAILADRGELTEAGDLLRRAAEAEEAAWEKQPARIEARDFLRGDYVFLANVLLQLGHYDEAARIAMTLAQAFPDRWEEQFAAAELLAQCGALARDDASLALAERTSLSEGYFALAEVCEEAIGLAPTGPMEAGAVVRPLVVPPILIPETSVGW